MRSSSVDEVELHIRDVYRVAFLAARFPEPVDDARFDKGALEVHERFAVLEIHAVH